MSTFTLECESCSALLATVKMTDSAANVPMNALRVTCATCKKASWRSLSE